MDRTGGGVIAVDAWDLPADIALPDRLTGRVRGTFRGTSAYLAHAMIEERILDIARGATTPRVPEAPSDLTPAQRCAWERDWCREHLAARGIHRREGRAGIPARNYLRCLIEAGAYERDQRMTRLTDATGSRVPGFIRIVEDFLPFPEEWQEWELDQREVVRRRRRVIESRAVFPKWGFTATIAFDPARFSAERLRHLIWVAGYRVGLGSFRKDPRRDRVRAVFGRFKIERWEVLTGDQAAEAA